MFGLWRRLQDAGVLGLNHRNADYILPNNPRRLYPLVDDKLITKKLAQENGIAVPELYTVVDAAGQVGALSEILKDRPDFVIKPANGSGGNGIMVVMDRAKKGYRLANGRVIDQDELEFHVSNTLSGIYSLGGQPDHCLIEYRVKFDPIFEKIAYKGVPDIRIIVFFGIPVMAMVRLPTQESNGRANLHQGAIGTGVDMGTGRTLSGVHRDRVIDEHPDSGHPVSGLEIPDWDTLVELAAKSYELTGLGYQGIDIVLDKELGPLILELNARPGLAIQIANREGMRHRLDKALQVKDTLKTARERADYARETFRLPA